MSDGPRCYFAFRSPYSRLGLHKLAASEAGRKVQLIVFTGPAGGAPFADPAANPHKLAYYRQDVLRTTMAMRLPLALPSPFDIDFTAANHAFVAADRQGKGLAFALAVSDARWGEGRNVSDIGVLTDCAQAAGWEGYDLRAIAHDETISQTLTDQRALIEADGVFGVPFLVDGAEKFWGQDRFDIWLAAR